MVAAAKGLKIGLVGAGNVATHLAQALAQAGHEITFIFSRQLKNALALSQRLSAALATDSLNCLPPTDIFIICISDDAIATMAQALAEKSPSTCCLHTAGSVPLSTISSHFRSAGVLYPLQTFSKNREVDFSNVPLFIEATDEDTLQQVEAIAKGLSDCIKVLDSKKRKSLHLAAVFACNFTNHCYALAEDLLRKEALDFEVLLPLIDETCEKVHHLSPREAQTGPASRWNKAVMQEHEAMLVDEMEKLLLYQTASRSIRQLSQQPQQEVDSQ